LPDVEIEYVVADARTDPTVAASEAERLITVEGVQAILGTYGGSLAMAIATVAERYGVPYFELTAAPNALTINASRRWIFRFGPAGLYYGYSAVDFLVYFANKMGWDLKNMKIAVVHEDSAYGTSCGDGDVERLEYYGLSYVTRERYSAATTDLSSLIMKLKGLEVEVVLITSYANDAILFLRQSHELGFKPKIIIGHSAGYELPATAEAVGELINGVFVVAVNPFAIRTEFMAPEVYQEFQEFIQYYRTRFGADPAGWASKSFTATYHVFLKQVIRIAYEKYREITPETIRLSFLEVDLPANATFMGFGAKFAPPNHPWSGENLAAAQHPVLQWIGGKMYAVWPEGVALREPVYIPRS
ncbi:MAG: ABC transporter substrate-binding protein, partial [Desulfurococcaceae archaeon]